MSKAQKIFIVIMMMILFILAIVTISKAEGAVVEYPADPQIDKKILINYPMYSKGIVTVNGERLEEVDEYYYDRLFCIQRGQELKGLEFMTYTYARHFEIVGDVATDLVSGVSVKTSLNANLAYVLAQDLNHYGEEDIPKNYEPVQQAVWYYIEQWGAATNDWFNLEEETKSKQDSDISIEKSELMDASQDYADRLQKSNSTDGTNNSYIIDNTNKGAITVNASGNNIRIGPFNWSFSGTLDEINVKDQNGNVISNVMYSQYDGTNLKQIGIGEIKSGQDFYILIPNGTSVSKITAVTARRGLEIYRVRFWILKPDNGSWQHLMFRERYPNEPQQIETEFEYDIDITGKIRIRKVNQDNYNIGLGGVGFRIKREETYVNESGTTYTVHTYVHQDRNGNISYVGNSSGATVFYTDDAGFISIDGLMVGKYIAEETVNPNYGYEFLSDDIYFNISSKNAQTITITNKQVYVKLSGYVWLDVQSGKQSTRNNLYNNDYNDDEDELLDGVIVRLKDRNGRTIKQTTTRRINLGDRILRYYLFEDVNADEVKNGTYYIEFEYDGLTYTNVTPHTNVNNGSKAAESEITRQRFNEEFSTIEGDSSNRRGNSGVALNRNGNTEHRLSYSRNTDEHTSTLINNNLPVGQYPITANTNSANYYIRDDFEWGDEEVPYINLGLYLREQPDLAVLKDMENVRLAINGYNHIYEYAKRFENLEERLENNEETGFNVGVKFGSELNSSYTRAIYEADYEYVTGVPEDSSRELQVYVTYRIAVRNESTNLITRVNSLVDYYDSRYELVAAGTGVNQEGIITGELNSSTEEYNDEYSKAIIYTNSRVRNQEYNEFYVQFKFTREAVVEILNNRETLDNVVEINSYSTFDSDGDVYAGVDVDSNPGNAVPGDSDTYEDDTDRSPSLQLVVKDARRMTGTVFEDETDVPEDGQNPDKVMTGYIRQGNSTYDSGEHGIAGVDVTLQGIAATGGMEYRTKTVSTAGWYSRSEFTHTYFNRDDNGNEVEIENVAEHNYRTEISAGTIVQVNLPSVYEGEPSDTQGYVYLNVGDFYIDDYIPGDYDLIYTWGDEEYEGEKYLVQNYKGTVYNKDRYDINYGTNDTNGDKEWYKNDVSTRLTDAVDDYRTRTSIDEYFKQVNNETLRGEKYTSNTEDRPTQMNSTTPRMGITVENTESITTDSNGNELVFHIQNIDFGIIERAKQDINLTKRIRTMKVTLANGQTLVNLTVDEDGNLSGQTSNVIYLGPSENNEPKNGLIRLEMDSELIEGSKLEIGYELKVENNSEKDYATKDYYIYGIITENEEGLVTISPTILDYLDNDWDFSTDTNTNNWESAIKEDGQVVFVDSNGKIMPPLSTDTINAIKDQKILFTDDLKNIKPAESASVALNVSKILTSSGDITLDNSAEVIQIDKPGGSEPEIEVIPGDYEPGSNPEKHDDDWSETTIITPNTGEDLNYIVPIVVIVTAFVIVGVGVIFIKKKVLNK